MTPRRRRRGARPDARAGGEPPLAGDHLPTLATLFGGYLHEDFELAYGSLEGAVAAFAADASADERRSLVAEIERLAARASRMTLPDLQRLIGRDLHSRWVPRSLDDVMTLVTLVRLMKVS